MKHTGVANPNGFVKMKPTLWKMKPIVVANINAEVGMPDTEVANLDAFVKMKATL